MGLVDWSNKYTVHDDDLDGQHQRLFTIINDLHKALLSRGGKEQIGQTITSLLAYAQDHFSAEERLMEAYGYPGLKSHMAEHQKLIQQVTQFEAEFGTDNCAVAPDLFIFLVKEWLTGHILAMDKNYALFISSARRPGRIGSGRPAYG